VLRAVGGYETDRDCMAWQDWMTHVKLVKAGHRVDVLPEVLFFYRVRDDGMLAQVNSWAREYQMTLRMLKKHFAGVPLSEGERVTLYGLLLSLRQQLGKMDDRLRAPRYRIADHLNTLLRKFSFLHRLLKHGWNALRRLRNLGRAPAPAEPQERTVRKRSAA
jgi:hypothetical protein